MYPETERGKEKDAPQPQQPLVDTQSRVHAVTNVLHYTLERRSEKIDLLPSATNVVLRYTLEGRAAKTCFLPNTQFVTIQKLKNKIFP